MTRHAVVSGLQVSRHDFAAVYSHVQASDPCAVPPLAIEVRQTLASNDTYLQRGAREVFVAKNVEEPGARALVWFDPVSSQAFGPESTALFSHWESIDDHVTVKLLFDAVREWARQRGARQLVGPLCPKLTEPRGVLVEGRGRPIWGMPYNPAYYDTLLRSIGFEKAMDMIEYCVSLPGSFERIHDLAVLARRRSPQFRLRAIDVKRPKEELRKIVDLYNIAWAKNWGFIPLDFDEFWKTANQLRRLLKPQHVTMLEHGDRLIAFQVIVPDLNEVLIRLRGRLLPFGWLRLIRGVRAIRSYRALFIGVDPEYRMAGADALLLSHIVGPLAEEFGIERYHVAWVLESNLRWRNAIERFGGDDMTSKRYRIYRSAVS